MNILITGGTGYIGEYLVPKLLEQKHTLTLLVRNIDKAKKLFSDRVKYIVGDITDKNSLNDCCNNIDIVIHMVAKVGNDLPNKDTYEKFHEVNVLGTQYIMEEAEKAGIKKFIYISSIAAMGIVNERMISESSPCSPVLPYQVTKFEAEQLLIKEFNNNGFPVVILRPTKVYGVGEHEYSFLKQIKVMKKGFNIIFGYGDNYISNINVNDFVDGIVKSINHGVLGNIYILSGKDSISADMIKDIVSKRIGKKIINIRIPLFIALPIVFFEERFFILLNKKPFITLQNVKAVSQDRIYDLNKAKNELQYSPKITMENGINTMIDWYENENLI